MFCQPAFRSLMQAAIAAPVIIRYFLHPLSQKLILPTTTNRYFLAPSRQFVQ